MKLNPVWSLLGPLGGETGRPRCGGESRREDMVGRGDEDRGWVVEGELRLKISSVSCRMNSLLAFFFLEVMEYWSAH